MHPKTKIGEISLFCFLTLLTFLTSTGLITSTDAFAAGDPITVQATVDRNEMDPGDTFTLTVSVISSESINPSQPNLPALTQFQVMNEWTSEEARASFVSTPQGREFKTIRTQSFNYMLQPTAQGQLTIGSIEVVLDGKSYNTKPITIRVAAGASARARKANPGGQARGQNGGMGQVPPGFPQPGDEDDEDLFSQLLKRQGVPQLPPGGYRSAPINPEEAFFIQVEVDKTDVYVGEQITASWYLYTRGAIRDIDTLKYPSLRGFWKEDIDIATHLNFTDEVINGVPYKKALLVSYALFPIKEGQSTIDPYQAKCTVMTGSVFGGGQNYAYTKASQPVKINVKPLPNEGRPKYFSGAVGSFEISSRVEDPQVFSNQTMTLKVRFDGKGNAKLIEMPPLELPQGLELNDTQTDAKFFKNGNSFKEFNVLLIPRQEGELKIPAISASIFDPVAKRYVTKSTEPITLHVGKGKNANGAQSLTMADGQNPAKLSPTFKPMPQTGWSASNPWTLAQQGTGFATSMILIALTLLWRARVELGWGQRKKDLARRLKLRMRKLDSLISKGDWRSVGVEGTNTVYFILGEVSGQGGANVELDKLLLKAPPSVRRELEESVYKLMEKFQILSFAPEAIIGPLREPAQLKQAVADLQKLMERAIALGAESNSDAETSKMSST
jgi:hypothetical protein